MSNSTFVWVDDDYHKYGTLPRLRTVRLIGEQQTADIEHTLDANPFIDYSERPAVANLGASEKPSDYADDTTRHSVGATMWSLVSKNKAQS